MSWDLANNSGAVEVQPWVPMVRDMGRTIKDGPAHQMTTCGARHGLAHTARHQGDILKMAQDLLGYVVY